MSKSQKWLIQKNKNMAKKTYFTKIHNFDYKHCFWRSIFNKIKETKYNFTHCFVCMQNLISHLKGRTQIEGVFENKMLRRIFGPTVKGSNRRMEKITYKKLHNLC
jgi:hypothetical protein